MCGNKKHILDQIFPMSFLKNVSIGIFGGLILIVVHFVFRQSSSLCVLPPESTKSSLKMTHEIDEKLFDHWLEHEFHATKGEHDEFCKNILRSRSGSASQFGQDLTVFLVSFKIQP